MSTKRQVVNSLKARLILSALLVILVLLPIIGLALSSAFEKQLLSSHRDRLSTYIYSILAVTDVDNGKIYTPETMADDQFNLVQSGLYALITATEIDKPSSKKPTRKPETLWQSQSLMGINLDTEFAPIDVGESRLASQLIENKEHFIYSYGVSFVADDQPFPINLHIIQDKQGYFLQLSEFNQQLWRWLITLMVLLIIIQLSWLLWTLKPLAKFKQELNQVELGEKMQLTSNYPQELADVASQLNALLNTEQNQRKRYRNALSDLAHSLKTPLAVIQSQTDLNQSSMEQVDAISNIIAHQLKRAQSAAGSSWHLGIKLKPVCDRLVRTLGKIYRQPEIQITVNIPENIIFKGDEADITEILGNLLDNACKAAQSKVNLSVESDREQLLINIEDDGAGISADKAKQIFERGVRADTYQQGHGIGLAIVSDLIDSYGGKLNLTTSQTLGGAHFICSFKL